jgi:hypothetical protein
MSSRDDEDTCPACGDTRLHFNPRPTGRFDEGDLWSCVGCGAHGESTELAPPRRTTVPENTNPLWDDNLIQFSRLLCEINTTQDTLNLEAIAEAMDLNIADVIDLFDRADYVWERAKGNLPKTALS